MRFLDVDGSGSTVVSAGDEGDSGTSRKTSSSSSSSSSGSLRSVVKLGNVTSSSRIR